MTDSVNQEVQSNGVPEVQLEKSHDDVIKRVPGLITDGTNAEEKERKSARKQKSAGKTMVQGNKYFIYLSFICESSLLSLLYRLYTTFDFFIYFSKKLIIKRWPIIPFREHDQLTVVVNIVVPLKYVLVTLIIIIIIIFSHLAHFQPWGAFEWMAGSKVNRRC